MHRHWMLWRQRRRPDGCNADKVLLCGKLAWTTPEGSAGVSWIDHRTGSEQQSSAPLVFLCASTLESTRLLMLSRSSQSPHGLGATSGVLGSYLMDHSVAAEGFGTLQSAEPAQQEGRCIYLPRFDARASAMPNTTRGYGVQIYQFPVSNSQFYFIAGSFAEMLPRLENRVTLDPKRRDAWGIPVLRIDCAYGETELNRARDQTRALRELAELAEVELTEIDEVPRPPGSAFHECGTARMGTDPANSVLDANNQCWDAHGLYVTDGACFPSQSYQNPTLTIMALTARACHHALHGMGYGSLAETCQSRIRYDVNGRCAPFSDAFPGRNRCSRRFITARKVRRTLSSEIGHVSQPKGEECQAQESFREVPQATYRGEQFTIPDTLSS